MLLINYEYSKGRKKVDGSRKMSITGQRVYSKKSLELPVVNTAGVLRLSNRAQTNNTSNPVKVQVLQEVHSDYEFMETHVRE